MNKLNEYVHGLLLNNSDSILFMLNRRKTVSSRVDMGAAEAEGTVRRM